MAQTKGLVRPLTAEGGCEAKIHANHTAVY